MRVFLEVIGIIAAVIVVVFAVMSAPSIVRYIRISNM
jgi:hypothetical protein